MTTTSDAQTAPSFHPLVRWRRAHHTFFAIIQALVFAHRLVERAVAEGDLHEAAQGLRVSADLFWASAAAMRLAGDMRSEDYARVRRSMEPPRMAPGFSGLHLADHVVLLQAVKRMRRLFQAPPRKLETAIVAYRQAVDAAYRSHAWVCREFVGDAPSLRMESGASTAEDSAPSRLMNHYRRRYLRMTGHSEPGDPAPSTRSISMTEDSRRGTAMKIPRILEPEVMDTEEEAVDYDAMAHASVNARFCEDLLALGPALSSTLDVGTGTAQIPIALCRRAPEARVTATDLADWMLKLGAANVERAGLSGVVSVQRADAKALPFEEGSFTVVMSNSIVHHIPEPGPALAEMRRVLRPGGWLFVRDLIRPQTDAEVRALVDRYAADANERQRGLFDASLRAALTLEEVRAIARDIGVPDEAVQATSDRHWTLAFQAPEDIQAG